VIDCQSSSNSSDIKGGFENLPYSEINKYPSELADGGFVGWKKITSNADGSVGPISYPEIRWDFNQKPFGTFFTI
jgi:hypothetical protein